MIRSEQRGLRSVYLYFEAGIYKMECYDCLLWPLVNQLDFTYIRGLLNPLRGESSNLEVLKFLREFLNSTLTNNVILATCCWLC